MTGRQPYVLAIATSEPDLEFPSLSALARAIVAARDALEGRPELVLVAASITRGELPGGACVSVRALAEGETGKGRLIGYAFVPIDYDDGRAARLLMHAILAVGGAVAA